ncbi:hypothetical protein pmac_cds_538 [Pandoravirus macleodensis]|uniref:Uncharacterized protein n=1 Tax=Pandoravirus macleodensis TaxID=2107707 RepID=A0A2U7UFK0_9VIRU|nr:hypothetical protein pmac_cds_538 [Pandoravirus macleodensis]AVK77226.1 hypothetical protein pmac_cds_538 [Pandoravirus macleodensis]UMO79953.1 hypothetical protein [Pandoravirus aubagnensis]
MSASSTTTPPTTVASVADMAAAATVAQRNRRIAWGVALAVAAVLLGVIVYFAVERRRRDSNGSYTPPPTGQILPSGRYRIKWGDFGFLNVWSAGQLYKAADLDPKATATNATVWTYDAAAGTLSTDKPENLVAIHYPRAPTALVYLVAPQNVPQVAGASSSGWVLSGPSGSVGASPQALGRITNTTIRRDVAYQGLVISDIYGVPQLIEPPADATAAARNRLWAFYPVASSTS